MISVVQLGTVDYATGLRLQQTLVELRKQNKIPNTLLLLEHTPVITLGRNAKKENVLASPERLTKEGVEVFECDRGGDVTYHGPGQLVGYPIFDLRSFSTEPGARRERVAQPPSAGRAGEGTRAVRKTLGAVNYVRRLEEVLIRTCADFGVATQRVPKLTGVWTCGAADPGCTSASDIDIIAPAKVAAIGVHISRGITSHGFALNVSTDLVPFDLIIPCGIATKRVTSLLKESGHCAPLDDVAQAVARNFGRVFHSQILWVDTLDALLGRSVGVPLQVPAELRKLHGDDLAIG
ncbi:MAG: lipoyl(octanoyl) transferase LipB [Terriglobales bacterium]